MTFQILQSRALRLRHVQEQRAAQRQHQLELARQYEESLRPRRPESDRETSK